MASLTGRSPVASEGLFNSLLLMNMVVDPPPSRLISSIAPNSFGRDRVSRRSASLLIAFRRAKEALPVLSRLDESPDHLGPLHSGQRLRVIAHVLPGSAE